jgi:hypothetical protein
MAYDTIKQLVYVCLKAHSYITSFDEFELKFYSIQTCYLREQVSHRVLYLCFEIARTQLRIETLEGWKKEFIEILNTIEEQNSQQETTHE